MNLEGEIIRAYGEYFIVVEDREGTLIVRKPWEACQMVIPITAVTHIGDEDLSE